MREFGVTGQTTALKTGGTDGWIQRITAYHSQMLRSRSPRGNQYQQERFTLSMANCWKLSGQA